MRHLFLIIIYMFSSVSFAGEIDFTLRGTSDAVDPDTENEYRLSVTVMRGNRIVSPRSLLKNVNHSSGYKEYTLFYEEFEIYKIEQETEMMSGAIAITDEFKDGEILVRLVKEGFNLPNPIYPINYTEVFAKRIPVSNIISGTPQDGLVVDGEGLMDLELTPLNADATEQYFVKIKYTN